MKTEQEQPEQVEPDGINFSQQSPDNVRNHRAATGDCPFENARIRGSGALHCYSPVDCHQSWLSAAIPVNISGDSWIRDIAVEKCNCL